MKKGKITGARAIVKGLESHGTEVIFGYPGGATLPIYDELSHSGIRHILSRHEQGAVHMADGYARATGKTGVCMATSGPGATNLVTGIATSYMDSSPVIALTGQVPRSMIGNDAFQEVDITGITIPVTKHNYLVQNASDLGSVISEAFHLASTGRRGPVLIDIPKDVQTEECEKGETPSPALEGYQPTVKGHPGQIKRAAGLLKSAERPLVIAGGGVLWSEGADRLAALTEKGDIPVAYTLMGKSVFPNSHRRCLGLIGYHGRVAANTALAEADVILAVGTRFTDRSTGPLAVYAPKAKIIHVDIDPAEISKNVPAWLPIVGEAADVLSRLEEELPRQSRPEWNAFLCRTAVEHPLRPGGSGLSIPGILETLGSVVDDPVIVTDVGRHQIYTAHYFPVEAPGRFITSGGLGTMGFGLPAAVGAKAGLPDRTVVTISGDGSFLMTCQELATAVEEKIPVLVLVMNDHGLGMIRQLQDAHYGKRYTACRFDSPVDYAALAESMGAFGTRIDRPEEAAPAVERAIGQALAAGRPAVIDCLITEPSNIYPMAVGSTLLECVE